MRCPLVAIRVFVVLLLAAAGSAFAQAPPFTISFTASTYTAAENASPSFQLTHTGTVPANTVIQLNVFREPGFTQTFGGGILWTGDGMTFTVAPDDHYYNPGQSYYCALQSVNNGGALGSLRDTTVTVIDDEQPPKVSIYDVTVVEGTGLPNRSAVFTVSLSTPLTVFAFVQVLVHDQTAKNIADYLWSSQSVTFSPGQTSATFSVVIIGDNLPEDNETFQVELNPSAPIQPGKTVGYCTIIDDDDAITPPFQRIGKGETGIINIRLKSPATVPAQVLFQASEADLLDVPGSVTIPVGGSEADVQFTGRKTGAGSILVTLPPSRGGRSDQLLVTVHDDTTLTIDPIQLNLSLGESSNVTARVDPVPAAPLRVLISAAKQGIVSVPDLVVTGADGRVVIPVRSLALGSTTVNIALVDTDGGASSDLGVNVTLGLGPVTTSVVPAVGRESGGASVQLNGFNFSNLCAVSFGGVPVPESTPQANGNAIVLVTPPHDAGVVDIAIRCGTRSYVFPSAFTYQSAPPKLTSVSPRSGTTHGGTALFVSGSDFRFGLCSARFGQTPALPTPGRNSTTNLVFRTPAHEAGAVSVSLVCGSQTSTLPGVFTYVATDDAPASSAGIFGLSQGALAWMNGSAFRGDDEVLVNGVVAPDLTTFGTTQHLFTLPELNGPAEITLRDYAGRVLTRTVTIAPPDTPVLTKLPARITLGAEFSVTGTGLRSGLTYMLGPAPMQLMLNPVLNSDRSVCTNCPMTPVFRAPISVGPGTVSLTIADHGTVLVTKSVEVTASGPAVSAIVPPCAAFEGGSLVTIYGSGFDDGALVQFGTTQVMDVVVKDRFTIIARVPPPFSGLQPQITVSNPDGSAATLTNAFSYKSPGDSGCGGSGGGRRRAAGH